MIIVQHKKTVHKVLVLIGLVTGLYTIAFSCNILSAGSYAHAEIYKISSPEGEVIKAVNDFKAKHPDMVVPLSNLPDGRQDSTEYWYHIYFYLRKENKIIHCWTRPENKSETNFAIIGINEGLGLGNWKEVNKDFSSSENKNL